MPFGINGINRINHRLFICKVHNYPVLKLLVWILCKVMILEYDIIVAVPLKISLLAAKTVADNENMWFYHKNYTLTKLLFYNKITTVNLYLQAKTESILVL